MNPQPIAFLSPELERMLARTLTFVRRLADGALARCQPGDVLWLREPFVLPPEFDHLSPLAAVAMGAQPTFLFEPKLHLTGATKVRPARTLPRDCHRFHLVITGRREEHLQAITAAEIAQAGFASERAFAQNWDMGQTLGGSRTRWADNPRVVVFDFELIRAALPPLDRRKPSHLHKKRGPKPINVEPRPLEPGCEALPEPPVLPPSPPAAPEKPANRAPALDERLIEQSRAFARRWNNARRPGFAVKSTIALDARPVRRIAAPPTLRAPSIAEEQTGQCLRCGSRLTFGCEHHPLEQEPAE